MEDLLMRSVRKTLAVFLSLWLVAPNVGAQQTTAHVADRAALDQAIAAKVAQAEADRDAIRRVLARQEVRDVARRAGIDEPTMVRAESAVALLDTHDLATAAEYARTIEQDLAGGATTIVITTTTIIIILLLVILILVIAD
jgi:hypothetical protein